MARLGDRAGLARLLETAPVSVHAAVTLKAAVDFKHHELVSWLLERGCDVNARSAGTAGEAPLHQAAWNGDLAIVRLLVEAGADVRARDGQYGTTPLEWAKTTVEVTNNPNCAEVAAVLDPLTGE